MTYEEAIAYLESFINYERKTNYHYKTAFKLERMKKFLSNLANPERGIPVVHVAGTKGKGSTACFIATILKEAGLRVGLYTSPHLVDFRERIRILDTDNTAEEKVSFPGMILKNDFAAVLETIRPQIEFFRRSIQNFGNLTFFEILTGMALIYFKEKNVDCIVLETGLGGRFDATNAVDSYISVITPISYDHEHILGNTLSEIAFEKAGIIKRTNKKTKDGFPVCVAAIQNKETGEVIKRRSATEGVVLFELDRDFHFKRLGGDLLSQDFFYKGLNNDSYFLKTRMLGGYQLANASLAIAACEALTLFGIKVKSDCIERGVSRAFWPGRLEVVQTKPFIILDGAHNGDSAVRLARFLEREFKGFKKRLIFGSSEDKDLKGIIEHLDSVADRIILTRADNPRAADPKQTLLPYFRKNAPAVTHSVEEALDLMHKELGQDEVAVITGSLFVVGEARALWSR
ncbi:MAG: bifunctional folylpolyglutamate synthase/dihydrofolate synthase [Candidatus Omnitrophica bacterium]|nr:bifunctional folylpolyglutamate synthase/dihydrofolate synthase [Candidatus Omnitrophota bacterium]